MFIGLVILCYARLTGPLLCFDQNTRSGSHNSHSTSSGAVAAGPRGTSGRPYGPSGGSGLSPDAYRRQHEITVTVSISCDLIIYFNKKFKGEKRKPNLYHAYK